MPGFSILTVFLIYRACLMCRALYFVFAEILTILLVYRRVVHKNALLTAFEKCLTVFPVYSVKLNYREIFAQTRLSGVS